MESVKKRRRTNAEILAASVAERNAPKKPRKRRTNAEIARDEEKARRAEALVVKTFPLVQFYADVPAMGKVWHAGENVAILPDSYWATLAYDSKHNLIFAKSADEQIKLWGRVKYRVKEEPLP